MGLTERFADSLLLLKRTFDFDARAPRMPPGSTLERRAGLRQSAYTPEDLKEGLAELKHWRTPDHDVYEVAAQLFDERFRRSGEEILDLVLSLPSRRRLAAAFHGGALPVARAGGPGAGLPARPRHVRPQVHRAVPRL